jgi:hypothetical protein
MTSFEERVRRIAREVMGELGREADDIDAVIEPPGADYCIITFTDPELEPVQVARPMGAGDSQEKDEIRAALQGRVGL